MKLHFLLLSLLIFIVCCNNDEQSSFNSENRLTDSINIANIFSQILLHQDSFDFYLNSAKKIVTTNNSVENQAHFSFLLGKNYLMKGKLTSVDSIAKIGLAMPYNESNINYKAKFYNLQGNFFGLQKKHFPSIEAYLSAEKIYDQTNNLDALAGIYSNIANSYFSLKDYTTALQYSQKAFDLIKNVQEINIVTNIMTTYAIALIRNEKIPLALSIEKKVDSIANATNNVMAKLNASIGYAEIYKSKLMYDSSTYYYQKCIVNSQKINQKHYELMSKMGMLTLFEETNQYDKIIANADSILNLAKEVQNQDVLHTAKRVIGKAYAKKGSYEKAFLNLNQSYNQYDSLAGTENQKNINELMLKFETTKKEKEITTQNYLLAVQKGKLQTRRLWIIVLSTLVLALFSYYIYYNKMMQEKNKLLVLEKEKSVNEAYIIGENLERKRLALEIHDGIASSITGIKYKMNGEDYSKNEIVNLLTNLHDEARMMSHKINPIDFDKLSFEESIQQLCNKMTSKEIEVVFVKDKPELKFNAQQKLIVYRVIQELINNALKHSECKSIFVRLQKQGTQNFIEIEDDGVGVNLAAQKLLLNKINERLEVFKSSTSIKASSSEGTTIKIEFDNE